MVHEMKMFVPKVGFALVPPLVPLLTDLSPFPGLRNGVLCLLLLVIGMSLWILVSPTSFVSIHEMKKNERW